MYLFGSGIFIMTLVQLISQIILAYVFLRLWLFYIAQFKEKAG